MGKSVSSNLKYGNLENYLDNNFQSGYKNDFNNNQNEFENDFNENNLNNMNEKEDI